MPQRYLHIHVNAEWFTIARLGNLHRDPSTDKVVKQMWDIVWMNEIMLFAGKWMQLEVTVVSELCQIR